MPQGGNFGGGSLPDVVVGGLELYAGRLTTYSGYTCTQAIATADTASYTYALDYGAAGSTGALSVTINVADAGTNQNGQLGPEMVIVPARLGAAPTAVAFLCYSCDCNDPMTGTTAFRTTGYGVGMTGGTGTATWKNPSSSFAPTIIGGGGLNN
jgi:hypothetical protein